MIGPDGGVILIVLVLAASRPKPKANCPSGVGRIGFPSREIWLLVKVFPIMRPPWMNLPCS